MVFCGSDTRILCSGWPKWMQFYMFGKVQDVLSKPASELLVFSSSECLCQEKFWSLNSTRCKAGLELNRGVALEKEMQVEHWSLPFAQIWLGFGGGPPYIYIYMYSISLSDFCILLFKKHHHLNHPLGRKKVPMVGQSPPNIPKIARWLETAAPPLVGAPGREPKS